MTATTNDKQGEARRTNHAVGVIIFTLETSRFANLDFTWLSSILKFPQATII